VSGPVLTRDVALFTDLYEWDRVGLPDESRVVSPISIFWKCVIVLLGRWMSPEGVYDVTVLLSAWAIFLCGYLLMTGIGASPAMAMVSAYMLSNLDNFGMRANGHLFGLGFYGASIFLVWSGIHYAKRPTVARALLLSLAYVFSLQVNEYNTYFGTFVLAATVPAALLSFHGRPYLASGGWRILGQLAVSAAVAVALCVPLFPNLIGSALLPGLVSKTAAFSVERPEIDFRQWTVGNPLAILQPAPALAGPVSSLPFFRPKHSEVSFRLGLLIFVSLGVFFACLRRWSRAEYMTARSAARLLTAR